ncbi:hypothetical protein ACQY0O_007904 [Thecaphora frezii]
MRPTTLLAAALSALASTTLVLTRPHSLRQPLARRDASIMVAISTGAIESNKDGENHSTPIAPNGAMLTTLPVGTDGHQLAVYWASNPNNVVAKQAFVMIHGRLRDGDQYWSIMNNILQSALSVKVDGADPNAIVVAPEFYSAKLNQGQYANNQLAWADVNAWQAGEAAIYPLGAKESSFDALDAFVDEFNNKTKYPAMERLIFVGHGGGGQLINRYAIVGKDAPSGLKIRWISGDPSSAPYFTADRPVTDASIATKEGCPLYNTWRYGFDNFTGTLRGLQTPKEYFAKTIQRDVRYVVGYDDTTESGDQYCMALLQGGLKRRDRNLGWWKYINTLARTAEDVSGFPGNFSELPDWSDVSLNVISHTLTVIEGATHDAGEVFGSNDGRAVLFSDNTPPTGWRPDGWNAKGNGQKVAASSSSSGKATSTASQASSSATGRARYDASNHSQTTSSSSLSSSASLAAALGGALVPLAVALVMV